MISYATIVNTLNNTYKALKIDFIHKITIEDNKDKAVKFGAVRFAIDIMKAPISPSMFCCVCKLLYTVILDNSKYFISKASYFMWVFNLKNNVRKQSRGSSRR